MRSMTGYGRGRGERDGWRVVVEIRSVNHRYRDLKLRGASLDPAVEDKLTQAVRSRVERGSVTVAVKVENGTSAGGFRVDLGAARRAQRELRTLARELRLEDDVSLSLLCSQPGVLVATDAPVDPEVVLDCATTALDEALDAMIKMREVEGAALSEDLSRRLDRVAQLVETLDSLVAEAPLEAQRRLEERLSRLLGQSKVELDRDRLAQEVAILADRHDVTEELVRLRSHITQARDVLAIEGEPVGRRLGFLVQEFGREFNTVSSKSQSTEISRAVVEAKAELEKMREQVQNIE